MRPIDADEFRDWVKHLPSSKSSLEIVEMALDPKYNTTPTLDAQPVVRCIYCEHYETSCCEGFYYCDAWDQQIEINERDPLKFFCAAGKKVSLPE